VTASFGIAGFQGKEPPEFSQLVRQADKALYRAKRAGRNQIKIELPDFPAPDFPPSSDSGDIPRTVV